jgi:hypothetical protein
MPKNQAARLPAKREKALELALLPAVPAQFDAAGCHSASIPSNPARSTACTTPVWAI